MREVVNGEHGGVQFSDQVKDSPLYSAKTCHACQKSDTENHLN